MSNHTRALIDYKNTMRKLRELVEGEVFYLESVHDSSVTCLELLSRAVSLNEGLSLLISRLNDLYNE